jgi:hypothetical protein
MPRHAAASPSLPWYSRLAAALRSGRRARKRAVAGLYTAELHADQCAGTGCLTCQAWDALCRGDG